MAQLVECWTSFYGGGSVVVDLLLIVTPVVGVLIVVCFVVRYFMSILDLQSSELVALLGLSSWCLVMVVWLFLTVPWVCHCGIS